NIGARGGAKGRRMAQYSRRCLICWFFIFPFLGSCPMASRQGQWPDPWAGVTECCSLLAGHREITGGGEASIERAGAEGLSFKLLNRNVDQPFKYVATWLIDEWSKIGLHVTRRMVSTGPWFDAVRSGNFDVDLEANGHGVVNLPLDVQ